MRRGGVGWEVGEGGCGRACVWSGEGGGEVLWSILSVASDEVSLEGELVGQVGFDIGLSRAPSEDAGPVCDVRPRASMRSSARSSSASATPSASPRTVFPLEDVRVGEPFRWRPAGLGSRTSAARATLCDHGRRKGRNAVTERAPRAKGRSDKAARSAAAPRSQRSYARTMWSVRAESAITFAHPHLRGRFFAQDGSRTGANLSRNLPRISVREPRRVKQSSPVENVLEGVHEILAEPDLVDVDEGEILVSSVLWACRSSFSFFSCRHFGLVCGPIR